MDKRTAKRECLKMWAWLRDNPGMWKDDYFKVFKIKEVPHLSCYLCEVCIQYTDDGCVTKCPLSFGMRYGCEKSRLSPYNRWNDIRRDVFLRHDNAISEVERETLVKSAQELINIVKKWRV